MRNPNPGTPSSARPLSITPVSRVLQTPFSDETIWKQLKEAGFDEETIKRRDKAALIAYITKLEAEIYDHQHHMGNLILELKDYSTKYDQTKTHTEATEMKHKRDQAAHLSALAAARVREESLKKALVVEKECITSIEKALHEMRAECAETKIAAESKFAEGCQMVKDAQKMFIEAEAKLHAAESLQLEANRYHSTAERKLKEVESREDYLSRRIVSFKNDCDEKEKEMLLERQSLSERHKSLILEHERLLDGQALLNQREDYIFNRSEELKQFEKELEISKENIEKELHTLSDKKSNLELMVASVAKREEDVIERECLLNKKEQELLVAQQKLASKESVEVEKIIANQEAVLRSRKYEIEEELKTKRKLVEDEIETKRRSSEFREMDIKQREDLLSEREQNLESQSKALTDKEKDVTERSNYIDEKEKRLSLLEMELKIKNALLQKEKEEIDNMRQDVQKSASSLEDKKKQVDGAKESLEAMKTETNELSVLELSLKEELDMIRSQKLELMAEADKLKVEKAKFEAEWELIDEKREEIQKEGQRIAEERQYLSKYLKDERNNIRQERDAIRDQHKRDVELLNRERGEFMNKMVHDRSEWFNKFQQERAEFLLGIEMQKRELENCIEKRREELESDLKDRERAFEEEKKSELRYINSLKETAEKELEQVSLEMKRLDAERMEINLDRERRNREWEELSNSIEELKNQMEKLKKQRELLHADREEINVEIEQLKKLEYLKVASDTAALAEMRLATLESARQKSSGKRILKQHTEDPAKKLDSNDNGIQKIDDFSPPSSSRFSWIKKCSELIFKNTPEKLVVKKYDGSSTASDHEHASLMVDKKLNFSHDENECEGYERTAKFLSQRQTLSHTPGEPKEILEVPPGGETAKGFRDLEPEEALQTGRKRKIEMEPEEALQTGRKRKIEISSSSGHIDEPSHVHTQNIKKRKQQDDSNVHPSLEAMTQSLSSAQPNVVSSILSEAVEESSVLVIDKIIRISEVTVEKTVTNDFIINQEKIDQLHELVVESDHGLLQDGDTQGLKDTSLPRNDDFQQKSELGENICRESEQSKEDSSLNSEEQPEDHGVTKLVDNAKNPETVGRRTRSKVKL